MGSWCYDGWTPGWIVTCPGVYADGWDRWRSVAVGTIDSAHELLDRVNDWDLRCPKIREHRIEEVMVHVPSGRVHRIDHAQVEANRIARAARPSRYRRRVPA